MKGLVTRAEWGAKAPTSAREPFNWSQVKGLAVHYTYWKYDFTNHANCAANLRQLQTNAFTRKYRDIEYNYLVCQHGYVFEGRTFADSSGANGETTGDYANLQYGAVCFMSDGTLDPTPVTDCFVWVRNKLLSYQPKATEVWPHQHFVATACPGQKVLSWLATNPFQPEEEPTMVIVKKKTAGTFYRYDCNAIEQVSAHQVNVAVSLGAKLVELADNHEVFTLPAPAAVAAATTVPAHQHPVSIPSQLVTSGQPK